MIDEYGAKVLRDEIAKRVQAEYPGVDYLALRIAAIFDEELEKLDDSLCVGCRDKLTCSGRSKTRTQCGLFVREADKVKATVTP